ncbi:MAG TPA: saccharopine dehydrogenase NADP-binding domain-containing protein [Candidatus Angelobacter sp.]|nr:saccharopine dehydrogenase NADP-binding domain-containing protein [Candidatus Angelobacter sp.]
MERTHTFGVVGGYGATGSVVVTELLRSGDGTILIGGRDLNKATSSAAELGDRVSGARVNALDARSLHDFCGRCSIIVNCAGPVSVTQDRVAQAAWRNRCHYVDVAGLSFVAQRLASQAQEITDASLSFVVSAGWMPGITELVPLYANAQARTKMDTIESLTVYFGDSGEWSENALRDAVWYLRQAALRRPGYFHRGKWSRARMAVASRKVDLGHPIGAGRFSLVSVPEQDTIGRQLADCDVFTYSYLSGFRTAAAAVLIALLPLPERFSVRLVRNMFRRNRLPVDGFALAQVNGLSQGRRYVFTAQVAYRDRRDYWINGLVPAITARMIAERRHIRHGVHFLGNAVDPITFMAELKKAGVEQTESLKADD